MRTPIRFLAVALVVFPFVPRSNAAAINLLTSYWKFATGDSLNYKDPAFNDAGWRTLYANASWESQGFSGYDGYAWYRQTVTIPSSLRSAADQYRGFILRLGKIDDCDQTYFNGTLIGATGQLPPNYGTAYDQDRVYLIPTSLVRWDAPNVIAVRVYDGGGDGGLYSGTQSFGVRGPLSHLTISPDFDRPDRVMLGASQRSGLSLSSDLDEALNLSIAETVAADDGTVLASRTESLALAPRSTAALAFPGGRQPPGFYSATTVFTQSADSTQTTTPFAVEPEQVVSAPDPQPDFQQFWDRARAELASVDPQFNVTLSSVQPFPNKTVYLVEMRSLGYVRIRAWLGIPNRPGKHPAILHLQGFSYGFSPTDMYGGDEFVTLALNIRGHGNSQDDFNPGFATYLWTGLASPETYVYRGAYMDCVRAVDFLVSRPEVDAAHIAVEGGSQGGALSYATAALDSRVGLCVPHIPSYSDIRTWFRLVPGTANFFASWRAQNPGSTEESVYRTLSYFDIKNLAPWIKVPTLMGVGLRDTTCPARIGFAAFNNLGGPKEWLVYPDAPHSLPQTFHEYKIGWIKAQWAMIPADAITTQPLDQVVAASQNVTFTVVALGEPTYQWQCQRAGSTTWEDLHEGGSYRGTATGALTVLSVSAAMSGDQFRCVMTGSNGTVTSTAAILRLTGGSITGLQFPAGIARDVSGNLYVADVFSNTILKITPAGVAATLAGLAGTAGAQDGTGSGALFNQPGGVAVDAADNVYVADSGNATIRRVTPGGAVTTIAGSAAARGNHDGLGSAASFNSPGGIAIDAAGVLYVADTLNATVRKIAADGTVSTLAGSAGNRGDADGAGSAARFNYPSGIATDSQQIYVADTYNATIRRITLDGVVTTVAGSAGITGGNDGTGMYALFNQPAGVAVGPASDAGNFYVADTGNGTIRRVTPGGAVVTIAGIAGIAGQGDGAGSNALFSQPRGLAMDGAGGLYVADAGNAAIRRIGADGVVSTLVLTAAPTEGSGSGGTTSPGSGGNGGGGGSGGGGGGGGGAPGLWFNLALILLAAGRMALRRRAKPYLCKL
jgi:cephalosporin-C deacetylase-like acetyl esterase/sugar lactone lactonase YvrE